jgi:hypothetical protein
MILETILFLACVLVAVVFIVKVYEWRQDVLYGPYIQASERARPYLRDQSKGTHRSAASSLR